jgi:hypothetical protein
MTTAVNAREKNGEYLQAKAERKSLLMTIRKILYIV